MDKPYPFEYVLRREIKRIKLRREEIFRLKQEGGPRAAGVVWEDHLGAQDPAADGGCAVQGAGPKGDGDAKPADAQKRARLYALDQHHAGLALSGGGIRSATFALGVLQGLASHKLLTRFDCLSTVSGGGYIGGWLAAWIKREGNMLDVEAQLSTSRIDQAKALGPHIDDDRPADTGRKGIGDRIVDEEPLPVYHLRSYSNYLTPRPGLLSLDTWTVLKYPAPIA